VQVAQRRVADEVGVGGEAGQVELEGVLDGLERLVVQAAVRVEEVEEVHVARGVAHRQERLVGVFLF